MIGSDELRRLFPGLAAADLDAWIADRWVRPEGNPGAYRFREIDVARIRLIAELREDLAIGQDAIPLVLSLLDQLHHVRRRIRLLRDVIDMQPDDVRQAIRNGLIARIGTSSPDR
jgi:chaperone modulatory protein CbpM